MQVWGEAVLSEHGCQAHLCFYSKASSEEGAGKPRAGVMGMRALNQPRGPLSHGKDIPAPCSSRRQCLCHACSAASAGAQPLPGQAPAAWGAGLQAVVWDRSQEAWFEEKDGQTGTWDKQHRAPYTLGT